MTDPTHATLEPLGPDPAGAGQPAAVVVQAPHRLDVVEAHRLRAVLDALCAGDVRRVVVDLAATTFIDSAGFASLVKFMGVLRRRGGDLELVRPAHRDAWRVFELTKFDSVFVVHDAVPRQPGTR